ncbi:MAG: spore gernimation protein [Firmicutes bacterium HGW-Firmicutes-14]|nr:MAG: spore gernimation protein [Firmicutes bacterium HGW-Firmicutes-14]
MKSPDKQAVITNTQFGALVSSILWPTIIGYGGGIMAREAGRDMWIGGILGIVNSLILAFILIYVGGKFPGKTIVEYCPKLVGFIPGKALGLLLCLYFLFGAYQSVAIYVHHMNDFLLTETPFAVITVIYVLVVCYLVWHGPEVIARLSVIGIAAALVFSFLVFLATLQEINFDRILPLLDMGLAPIANAGLTATSFIGPNILVIAMVLPLVKVKEKAGRPAAAGLLLGGILFTFYFIAELMVMGPHVTALMRVACMDLVRSLQITQYLHRFESFMVTLWYWSMLVQAGILTYCAVQAFQQIFGLKKINIISVVTTGILLGGLTYVFAFNRTLFLNFLEGPWDYISLPVYTGIPVLLLTFCLIRRR